jgi:hypothetical protein
MRQIAPFAGFFERPAMAGGHAGWCGMMQDGVLGLLRFGGIPLSRGHI